MKCIIEKLDDFGRGITYFNNKITFIPKCIPGDEIDFVITKELSKYFLGRKESLIKKSIDRQDAKCPFYETCGGCSLQNYSYEKTIQFKKEKIANLLKRNKIDYKDINVVKNSMPYNYRNKVSLKIDNGKIGYYEESTHNITNINKCLLASHPINKTIELLPLLNIKNALVTIRSNYQDEVLLIINTKEKINNIPSIFEEHINLKGIILNDKLIYGTDCFEEKINDLKYQVSYNSFFQVNPYITKELFKIITNHLEKDDIVYDLYCGVGAISLQAAKKVKQVIGIEVVKNAVINAVKNKKLNNINNAEFLLHDLKNEFKTTIIPNTIIIDPPRGGIDKKTMEWIINIQPKKIIYISCNPNTLVRDIKLLNNYTIKEISILDMFSYTHHCESVCILERR